MQDKGIYFVLASGNQYLRIYHQFIPMSENIYFVADNGAYIAHGPKVLAYHTLTDVQVRHTLKALERYEHLVVMMSGLNGTHLLKKDKKYEHVAKNYYRNLQYYDSFDEVKDKIMKITLFDPKNDIHLFEDEIRSLLDEGITATTAGNEWLDVQPVGVNKGNGIKLLQEKLGVSPDECVAFGDAMNDFSMFKSVTYSYAMKNADDRIKAIAREVLPYTNEENGVVKKIREILNK
jgi:sugar-phosphatase